MTPQTNERSALAGLFSFAQRASPVRSQPLSITVPSPAASLLTLDQTHIGQRCIVRDVCSPTAAPEWARWLDEIGFVAGEQVTLMARGAIGGDPLVVRVGTSTFALRRAEAACVRVEAAA